jgi:hypothetical protein
MKKLLSFLFLCTSLSAYSQCGFFEWRTDTPKYPDADRDGHTYNAVDGSTNVAIGLSGGTNLGWQAGEPRVPSTGADRLTVGINLIGTATNPATAANGFVTFTFTFSQPVCGLNFNLYEIDRGTLATSGTNNGKYDYVDEVVVSATDNSNTALATPTITPSSFVSVAGNVITGTGSDASNSPTTITYPSSTCVKTLSITYRTGAGARNGPVSQLIAIGCMNWSSPMPVTLTSFQGQISQTGITINWQTAAETNSERFDVQRSSDVLAYEAIGTLSAAKASAVTHFYEFIDQKPIEGTSYYRLKMIDQDGSFTFSRPIAIQYQKNDIYFNLITASSYEIVVETNAKEPIFEIFDLLGRSVMAQYQYLGGNRYRVLVANSSIFYLLKMQSDNRLFTKKIMAR